MMVFFTASESMVGVSLRGFGVRCYRLVVVRLAFVV
jgi:hypothetical protein